MIFFSIFDIYPRYNSYGDLTFFIVLSNRPEIFRYPSLFAVSYTHLTLPTNSLV